MNEIQNFIKSLQKQKTTDTVFNQYRDKSISDNLKLYLEYMFSQKGKRIMLVGEAPGYKGCRITGIPFTSGKLFQTSKHPCIKDLSPKVQISKVLSENTAKIVWDHLTTIESTPLFWNAFPFHPHIKNIPTTNRKPNKKEMDAGSEFLQKLSSFYKPDIVAGIGRKGESCAKKVFPGLNIAYIRHPSFGGKKQFIQGLGLAI